ncbi:HNH endonuclease [Flagellimonas pelagia]|uniref:HNH endonuclease n=1 Tax=Flagellimonas pelagia TaxID=2306998 RepID=A0A3A1NIJ3_9FLAO|nr:HNH endonuclease [Allomuricauda maritima]RIV42163.1 HNH endonuclease [Allomuricauda maritima]TXJ91052.1 hypothetical protein FQ017_18755 [Allomuricauda maritima]
MATWLVLHNEHSDYGDIIGEIYEFPIGIPNSKQIKIGDTLVFCLTKKSSESNKRILGFGQIIQLEPRPPMANDKHKRERFAAYLTDYRKFNPLLSFDDIGGDPRTNYTNSISRVNIDFSEFGNEPFNPIPNDDFNEKQQYARIIRRGQFQFREELLKAYDYKCAVSGHGPINVLEACHILPHSKSGINQLDNGILLRSDLHNLFDDGYLRIQPSTYIIEVDSTLSETPYYKFNGEKLRARGDGKQPNNEYLQKRNKL